MTRVLLLVAAVPLLAGCGGGIDPDMGAMERDIEKGIVEELGPAGRVTVDCPSSIEWSVGDDFRCFAEDKRGHRAQVVVHMQNKEGEYVWELKR